MPRSFDPLAAARWLDEQHRARKPFENLPEEIAPVSLDEAYRIQEAWRTILEPRLGPLAGLKIATTTKVMQALMGIDHPCGGMIYARRVHESPARIALGDYTNIGIECELAVELGADIDGPAVPDRSRVRAAVARTIAAFELIDDRHAHYKSTKALSLIADNAWNAGVVRGSGRPAAGVSDPDDLSARLEINGRPAGEGRTDDPLGALAWCAALAIERGRPLRAGMIVITGSVIPTFNVAAGDRIRFALDGIGEVAAEFA